MTIDVRFVVDMSADVDPKWKPVDDHDASYMAHWYRAVMSAPAVAATMEDAIKEQLNLMLDESGGRATFVVHHPDGTENRYDVTGVRVLDVSTIPSASDEKDQ